MAANSIEIRRSWQRRAVELIQHYELDFRPHGSNETLAPDGCECDECNRADQFASLVRESEEAGAAAGRDPGGSTHGA